MLKAGAVLFVSIVAAFVSDLRAHGREPHVMGIVQAVDAHHVEVKKPNGALVSALLTKDTKYFKGKARASGSDLKMGLRVVLHLRGEGQGLTVNEVRLPSDKMSEVK